MARYQSSAYFRVGVGVSGKRLSEFSGSLLPFERQEHGHHCLCTGDFFRGVQHYNTMLRTSRILVELFMRYK